MTEEEIGYVEVSETDEFEVVLAVRDGDGEIRQLHADNEPGTYYLIREEGT